MRSSVALALALASLLLGCVENRRTWYIRQNQVITGDPPDCLVPDDVNAAFRTSGLLDLALRDTYVLTPLIENQMMKRKDYAHLRDEANGIQVDGAIVRGWCNAATGDPTLTTNAATGDDAFFSPASSYIDPQDTGASSFIAIHAGMADALRGGACGGGEQQIVILGVRMTGITNGGIELETPEFFYPVFTCNGCLALCAAEADDEDQAGADCCSTDAPTTIPCAQGQDDSVDCRLCRGNPACVCGNACL